MILLGQFSEIIKFCETLCILWSGVLEWGVGVEYWSGMELNFGVKK